MGIDAIIMATTAKRATAAEIVEWGRRLRSACGHVCEDYEAVPTEVRPEMPDDNDEGDVPHTGRDGDRSLGGLVIREVSYYDDHTFVARPGFGPAPSRSDLGVTVFMYEVCTLQRSAWFDDDARRFSVSRGHVPAIVQAATALALLMDPTVVNHHIEHGDIRDEPLGYEQRDDWRVWLGNDSSYHMEEFDHATRVELFEAYIRSGLVGDGYWGGQSYPGVGRFATATATPCPVCGCKWRFTGDLVQPNRMSGSDAKAKCPACYHGFASGKKMDDGGDDWKNPTFPSKERFRDMTPHEREVLVRGLGEALQEAGVGEAANYLTSWVSPDLDALPKKGTK